jgi:hypothetical protein
MTFENYREALIESAAAGTEPTGAPAVHSSECPACRSAFERERSLFVSIDTALRATANAPAPPSLLTQVQARLAEENPRRRVWISAWAFAAAATVPILAVVTVLLLNISKSQQQAAQQASNAQKIGSKPQKVLSPEVPTLVAHSSLRPRQRETPQGLQSVMFNKPEVIVPPDERDAFANFISTLQGRREIAVAFVSPAARNEEESLQVEPLQISRLEFKTLEDSEDQLCKP